MRLRIVLNMVECPAPICSQTTTTSTVDNLWISDVDEKLFDQMAIRTTGSFDSNQTNLNINSPIYRLWIDTNGLAGGK